MYLLRPALFATVRGTSCAKKKARPRITMPRCACRNKMKNGWIRTKGLWEGKRRGVEPIDTDHGTAIFSSNATAVRRFRTRRCRKNATAKGSYILLRSISYSFAKLRAIRTYLDYIIEFKSTVAATLSKLKKTFLMDISTQWSCQSLWPF